MAEYAFLTTWVLEAPRQRIWDAIYESETWPRWWKGVKETTELAPGDDDGLGRVGRYVWRSKLPYDLAFEMRTTRIEKPHLLEGEASGELAGTGVWRLFEADGMTAVVYEWRVRTTKRWMNLFSPMGRPLFAWNHDHVMRRGGEGLATLLDARLLASD